MEPLNKISGYGYALQLLVDKPFTKKEIRELEKQYSIFITKTMNGQYMITTEDGTRSSIELALRNIKM